MVFDDGVVMHLGPDHWLATTTTGGAAAVLDWMEEWLQTEWTDLRVRLTSVTDHWADVAVVGPPFADVVRALFPKLALDPRASPSWRFARAKRLASRAPSPDHVLRRACLRALDAKLVWPWAWEAVMAAGEPLGYALRHRSHATCSAPRRATSSAPGDGRTVTPQDLG